jgi:hypothetical protein
MKIPDSAYFQTSPTIVRLDQPYIAELFAGKITQIIEPGWQGLDSVNSKSILPPIPGTGQSYLSVKEKGGALT